MNKPKIKLNLGCGPTGLDNWLNYDYGALAILSKFPSIKKILLHFNILPKEYKISWPKIKLVDIRKKFPLENNSVAYIYCSHVLEHFPKWEAQNILQESRRVLVKKGIIRIILPDISKILKIYEKDKNADEICRLWWGFDKSIKPKNFLEQISRFFIRSHEWNYDSKSICLLLKNLGFENIKKVKFRCGKTPEIRLLDLKVYKNHSLYIEASKK